MFHWLLFLFFLSLPCNLLFLDGCFLWSLLSCSRLRLADCCPAVSLTSCFKVSWNCFQKFKSDTDIICACCPVFWIFLTLLYRLLVPVKVNYRSNRFLLWLYEQVIQVIEDFFSFSQLPMLLSSSIVVPFQWQYVFLIYKMVEYREKWMYAFSMETCIIYSFLFFSYIDIH